MPEVTLEHIRDLIQGARDESRAYDEGIRAEIRGVNRRLDVVNGRLDKHGDRIGVLERHPRLAHGESALTEERAARLWGWITAAFAAGVGAVVLILRLTGRL